MFYKKYLSIALTSAFLLTSPISHARDEALYLPIADVLNSDEAKQKLDGSVKFYFAQSKGGKTVKARAVANRKTNGFAISDEEACKRAMLSALISFQDTAKKLGAGKVNNLVSFYKKNVYTSTTQYECHAGGFVTGVALRGDIAK